MFAWLNLFRLWKILALAGLFLLLFFMSIYLPYVAADGTIDLGSHAMFAYHVKAHYQFGVDVVHPVGPYGFLQFPGTYAGMLTIPKVIYGIAFGAMFATLILLACRYYSNWFFAGVWLITSLAVHISLDGDADPAANLFILLAGHHLLTRDRYPSSRLLDALVFVFLAVFCLMKATNLAFTVLLLGLAGGQHLAHRRPGRLVQECGWFLLAIILLWLLAGQHLRNLPQFLGSVFSFASGYNEALAQYAPGEYRLIWLALAFLGLFLAANAVRLWFWRDYLFRVPVILLEGAFLFLEWKHGHVRIGHAIITWRLVFAAAPLLFLAHEPPVAPSPPSSDAPPPGLAARLKAGLLSRRSVFVLLLAGALTVGWCALSANALTIGFTAPPAWRLQIDRFKANVVGFCRWDQRQARLDRDLRKSRTDNNRPDTRRIVGEATIDQFGFLPGVVVLNDLNYRCRPMPISFSAFTDELERKNAEYYRRETTAPEYLLTYLGSIDQRLVPQDDALAFLQMLFRYRPVALERADILLRRVPGAPEPTRTPLGRPQQYTWDDSISLFDKIGGMAWNGQEFRSVGMLWCCVDIRPSLLGRLRNFLYKPPEITIVFESGGKIFARHKFLACVGTTGFLLNPLILNNADLLQAYHFTGPGLPRTPQPDSFHFELDATGHRYYQPTFHVSFYSLPPLP